MAAKPLPFPLPLVCLLGVVFLLLPLSGGVVASSSGGDMACWRAPKAGAGTVRLLLLVLVANSGEAAAKLLTAVGEQPERYCAKLVKLAATLVLGATPADLFSELGGMGTLIGVVAAAAEAGLMICGKGCCWPRLDSCCWCCC